MSNPIYGGALWLIQLLFSLVTMTLLVRLFLQWVGTNFYNPLMQSLFRYTNPVVMPVKRLVPTIAGFDFATLLLILVVQMLKLAIIISINTGGFPHLGGLIIWGFAGIIDQSIDIFFYAILIVIILSWVNPMMMHPLADILHDLTLPILRPVRLLMPLIAGIDLSGIAVLIGLKLLSLVIVQPLMMIGINLSL